MVWLTWVCLEGKKKPVQKGQLGRKCEHNYLRAQQRKRGWFHGQLEEGTDFLVLNE